MKNSTKLIFIVAVLSLLIVTPALAQTRLEVNYPSLPGIKPPVSLHTYLPHYIRYIYIFIVVSGGLIAFIAMLMGGFSYLTSAGNPARMKDARNRIISGIIGLIVILSSYVILNEINPNLLTLTPPHPEAIGRGIILYHSQDDCGNSQDFPLANGLKEGQDYIKIENTSRSFNAFHVGAFYSFNSRSGKPAIKSIEFYNDPNCQANAPAYRVPNKDVRLNRSRQCYKIPDGINLDNIRCVKIIWYIPGVWLFSYKDGDPLNPSTDPKDKSWAFSDSQSYLPEDLTSTKIKSIALVPDTKTKTDYGVVLYNQSGVVVGQQRVKGWTRPFVPDQLGKINKFNLQQGVNIKSLTLFAVDPGAPNKDITICREPIVNGECRLVQKKENGKEVEKMVSITYHWGGSAAASSLTNANSTEENLSKVKVASGVTGLSNASIVREGFWGEKKKWQTGDQIKVCSPDINWLTTPISAFGLGACQQGVSGVKVEDGASYLIILYRMKDETFTLPPPPKQFDALPIVSSAPNLQSYNFDNAAGGMLVIKIKTSL